MLCHWEKRLKSKGTHTDTHKKIHLFCLLDRENNFRISLFSHHFQSAELKKEKKKPQKT